MSLDRAASSRQAALVTRDLISAVYREPSGVRLTLQGELDMSSVLETEMSVRAAAEITHGRLVIDLGGLTFMDIYGGRALLHVADEVMSSDREVMIANPSPHVRRVFELIADVERGRTLVADLVQAA